MAIPNLDAAFRATTYRVLAEERPFDLRIGRPDPGFAAWLARQGATCWAILTACNPGGRLALSQNEARTADLLQRIRRRGWRHVAAVNHADTGDWPEEPGVCVFDIAVEEACALAAGFGQAAIVFGGADGKGELIWLKAA